MALSVSEALRTTKPMTVEAKSISTQHDVMKPASSSMCCFWTLLSMEDMRFLYISPNRKGAQSHAQGLAGPHHLLNTSLFVHVHPEEVAEARSDLGQFVAQKPFYGSITR
jgi:hypothetical protein